MKNMLATKTLCGVLAATAFALAPPASHAQSVTLTQNFTTSPASWTAVMQPGSQNNFGWSNTSFASGTAGEAGGTITRSASYSTYTTAVSNLNRASTLTMSGNMYFQNTDFDGGFYLGFFDSAAFSGTAAPADFVGFIVAEPSSGGSNPMRGIPRSIAGGNSTDGSVVSLNQLQQLTFNLTYTGSGNGSGTLTGTLGGTNIGTISTPAGSSTFNAFGLASGSNNPADPNLNTNFYFDNVSYTSGLNLYWDNSGGTANSWGDASNWSTTVAGGSSPSAAAGAGDVARFSATPIVGTAQTVNLNANQSVLGLAVESAVTQGITFQGGGTIRTLTIGADGVTNASNGAGSVQIGVANSATQNVNLTLNGSQSWANNGTQPINVRGAVTGLGSPTFTNNGTGTGGVGFGSPEGINNTVNKFVQDSATSTLSLRAGSNIANTFSGGVEVRQGTLLFGNADRNLGTGTLTLGVNGGTGAVTALINDNSNRSFANAIVLTTGHTGPITIRMNEDQVGVSHSKTFTGGITGTNSFTIQNDGGDDNLNFDTGSINNVGAITHTGSATTGVTTINSVIDSNVTGLTQSGPAGLVLNGINAFTGPTTINGGTLTLGATGALASSAISVGSGGTFNVSAKSGFSLASGQTLGGLGTLVGATEFGTGSLLAFDPTGPLVAQSTLTFSSFGISSLANVNWGSLATDSPYTLISGVQDFAASAGLNNFGEVNKFNVGGGREAYFQAGGVGGTALQLVVVPEPAGIALAGLGVAAAAWGFRRRVRRDEPTAAARS
jgi:autotransporter-associated beta strand protein